MNLRESQKRDIKNAIAEVWREAYSMGHVHGKDERNETYDDLNKATRVRSEAAERIMKTVEENL